MIRTLFTAACSLVLAAGLHAQDAKEAPPIREVILKPDNANPLAYDPTSKTFTVKVGEKFKVTLENKATIPQPHNLLICKPGSLQKVGAAANGMLTDPQAMAKDYVPESPEVLHHTKLVQPGQSESLEITAPSEPGDYVYLCTFPGHWILMNGIMKVEK
ncbi:MAG: plastocyanin/azurin family copper-binding protein [Roseimicrobium sp.]